MGIKVFDGGSKHHHQIWMWSGLIFSTALKSDSVSFEATRPSKKMMKNCIQNLINDSFWNLYKKTATIVVVLHTLKIPTLNSWKFLYKLMSSFRGGQNQHILITK